MTKYRMGSIGNPDGPNRHEGLDWAAVRRAREERQGPEIAAREAAASPFDERGNLRSKAQRKIEEEVKAKAKAGRRVDVKRAVEMYRGGSTVAQIAAELDVTTKTIRAALTDEGVYDPRRDRSRKGVNTGAKGPRTVDWDVIRLRHEGGESAREIARRIGCDRSTVDNALKQMGLTKEQD